MRIAIVSDAWRAQVNGVVTTLEKTVEAAQRLGAPHLDRGLRGHADRRTRAAAAHRPAIHGWLLIASSVGEVGTSGATGRHAIDRNEHRAPVKERQAKIEETAGQTRV